MKEKMLTINQENQSFKEGFSADSNLHIFMIIYKRYLDSEIKTHYH